MDHSIYRPLIEAVHEIGPDLIAVSGDLTQRARGQEFRDARAFLDALPKPQIVVPGNHDVPLHNVYARFVSGLDLFYQMITEERDPFFADEEIAVLGINTARALVLKGGRVNATQVARIEEHFHPMPGRVKILVAHHPFELPEHLGERDLVGRAKMAMAGVARCGGDMVLSGHLHVTHSLVGSSAIFVQAGTALSTRGRGETNSFNAIQVEADRIGIRQHAWDAEARRFAPQALEEFHRTAGGWHRV